MVLNKEPKSFGFPFCFYGFKFPQISIMILVFLFLSILPGFAAQIKVAWDQNTDPNLAGYEIYYGTTSGSYGTPINAGKVATYTISNLTAGKGYYVTLKAYDNAGNKSGFSNEVYGTATDPGSNVTIPSQTYTLTVNTNPAGLKVVVDGTTYTSPQTFNWVAGSSHTISVASSQVGTTGTSYVFSSWSDSGAASHTITAPSANTTYAATFIAQPATGTGGSSSTGIFSVTPSNGLNASGTEGGPFNPANQKYTLKNTGSASITWSASKGQNWITLSASSGTLRAGRSTTVTVSFNSNANSLTAGSYSDTITIRNTSTGSGDSSFPVTLSIAKAYAAARVVKKKGIIDFDGDGKTDIAVWRPGNGTWYVNPSSGSADWTAQLGQLGDIPVPGDYDGDGDSDLAVFRPGNGMWYIVFSSNGSSAGTQWGGSDFEPVPGDYDGDGKMDIAVYRPGDGTWHIKYSSGASPTMTAWGGSNFMPIPGDYDGDGKVDIAVYRPGDGTWHIKYSSGASPTMTAWGQSLDIPVPGDFDGDGKTDLAVWRPGEGNWYIRPSSSGGSSTTINLGDTRFNDVPIVY